jgi:hypothetical protein
LDGIEHVRVRPVGREDVLNNPMRCFLVDILRVALMIVPARLLRAALLLALLPGECEQKNSHSSSCKVCVQRKMQTARFHNP